MANDGTVPEADHSLRLRNFHITFFAIALGLAGFALAVQKLVGTDGSGILPSLGTIATGLVSIAVGMFVLTTLVYLAKGVRYPGELMSEVNHPVKINFFPLIAKILLVLSVIYLDRDMASPTSCGSWGLCFNLRHRSSSRFGFAGLASRSST